MAWGLQRIASGLGGILYGAMPLFTAAFAWGVLRRERLGPAGAAGLLLGFSGVVVVIGPEALIDGVGGDATGELVTLLAPLSYALGVVVLRRMGSAHPLRLTAAMLGASAVILAPISFMVSSETVMDLSSRQWLALIGLATVATALPAWLNQRLVAAVGAVNASLVMFVMPPLAVLYGSLAFGEQLQLRAIAGMAMIVVAGYLVTCARRL
jgi:drug/metabolite transporter (DMT)-like permease